MMNKNAYSVSQINAYIKNMFVQDFVLRNLCIKGEVSNCKYHSSGHVYFTLKDENGQISAIMFAGNRKNLKFIMKDGDIVVTSGVVDIYERDGKYQFYARAIEKYGEGDLYQQYQQLKQDLEEMGMFSMEYKKPIPLYPKTIGIVTSKTGAVIEDIKTIANRRNPYVQLILYPAVVQGEFAAASIVKGILALEQYGVDVIIVGRGGGSIEDLWAFNEEIVARAIFDCQTPIISAVGHETDTTIADFVADLRAPTPSAAAELAIKDVEETLHLFQEKRSHLQRIVNQKLIEERNKLRYLGTRLELNSPENRINQIRQTWIYLEERLNKGIKQKVQDQKYKLLFFAKTLEGLSPLKKLSQGFSCVIDKKGTKVTSVDQVKVNEELNIQVSDGDIRVRVLESNKWSKESE